MTASSGTWKFIVWERLNKTGKWIPYSAEVSLMLETSFQRKLDSVSLGETDEALNIYSVNLKDMVQVSEKTGTKCTVRRHLYSNIDSLCNGFTWQWCDSDKDTWHSYDIDVNTFIENAHQKGQKSTTLKKTFKGYNYEIDFVKMLQINKQSKRKRSIRRQPNASFYPVEQSLDSVKKEAELVKIEQSDRVKEEYSDLAQDVPGTSALVEQLNSYVRSVTMDTTPVEQTKNPVIPQPPKRKKNKRFDLTADNNNVLTENSVITNRASAITVTSNDASTTTYALVNNMPWHHSSPPHTPSSLIKPVPGIDPLPKLNKKSAKRKKASLENEVDIFELHTDEVLLGTLTENAANEMCIICCEALSTKSSYNEDATIVKLKLCSHIFHRACLQAMYNSGPKDGSLQCPTCKKIHGEKCGIQPCGEMIYHVLPYSLPSFSDCDTIRIIYDIPSGTQGKEHPRPGKKYTARGFPRHCYLPDNEMGRKILRLLVKAWKRRLIFTIGRSTTTGEEDTVTWNEIHHKTEFGCNRRGHGYPDANYFDNVLAELEAHGVNDNEVYLWYPA